MKLRYENKDYEIFNRMTIGRMDNNDLVIDSKYESVSRHHARIIESEGKFIIIDACSKNGVFVNDNRVARKELRTGDKIRLGKELEIEVIS